MGDDSGTEYADGAPSGGGRVARAGDLDGFFDRLDPDMCVVTAAAGGERAGCLVGFASQCSIRPPRFVVWLSKANRTYRVARAARHLAVHLLTRDQRDLAERFGGRTGDEVDKFAGLAWREGPAGTAVLDEAAAWFTGSVVHRVDGGDHVGHVLDPVEWGEGRPGTLLRLSDAATIEAGHPA
ncbi:flavin reductase family protein [Streptomyces achromogenes]|uniref:flavin reductase family protein n=1 Tax=Streptomyces achromogenes TaxID=67255 RepID=UPI003F4CC9E4